jgi:peptidoglycan/xylan/chitin deacetylase (PgdA/CDA1 family)
MKTINKLHMILLALKNLFINSFYPSASILLYHRVESIDKDRDSELLCVSPKIFDAQIKFLKENYNVVSINDLSKITKRSVAISFDDGYRDNLINALPVLEKYNVPAIFFITTNFLKNKTTPYWDWLSFYSNHIEGEVTFHSEALNKRITVIPNDIFSYRSISHELKIAPPFKRELFHQELSSQSKLSFHVQEDSRFLSIEDLREFSQHPLITIGAHTQNHPQLSSIPKEEQKLEIAESIEALEKIIGKPIQYFAYPFGLKSDYNSHSIDILNQLKVKNSFSNFRGQFRNGSTPPHEIPRYLIRNWNTSQFAKEVRKSFLLEDIGK